MASMRRPTSSGLMRTGKMASGSGALQSTLSLPPGTIVIFGEDPTYWRAAKLVVVSPAPVRLGGGLELTVTYNKSEVDTQEITETVTLPAGQVPLVVDEQLLVDCEDVSLLSDIHEANVLHCLYLRYHARLFFTRVGNILISICPPPDDNYKPMDKGTWKRARQGASQQNRAHIFGVAEVCLDSVRREKDPQCVVMMGESGSGKSVCGKHFLDYFAFPGSSDLLTVSSLSSIRRTLNALGHATTKTNNDSSRMGLLWQLRMNSKNSTCVGLSVSSMMLEVKRVTNHSVDERSFHLFHEMCMASPQLRKKLQLEGMKPRDFKFLRPSTSSSLAEPLSPSSGRYLRGDGVNDVDMAVELVKALELITPTEPGSVHVLLRQAAAVLHLGEIDFDQSEERIKVKPSSAKALSIAAHLLEVEDVALSDALISKTTEKGSSRRASILEAYDSRDALAKTIFQSMVNQAIMDINAKFGTVKCDATISLLDLPGFDCLTQNTFDDLLINFGCEFLQRLFVHEVFEMEREHCIREGVECEVTSGALALDNSKRLVALAGSNHPSLLPSKSNPATAVAGSKDAGLLRLLDELSESVEMYDLEEHADLFDSSEFIVIKPPTSFTVIHYFGKVCYDAATFPTAHQTKFCVSHAAFDKSINANVKGMCGTRSQQTLQEVSKVIQTVRSCSLHFVKCLRAFPSVSTAVPSRVKATPTGNVPGFDRRHVCSNLRSSGLLEAAALLRQSRPIRWSHQEFARKFTHLLEAQTRPHPTSEVMSDEVAASWQLKEKTSLVSYVVTFHSASMGFGLKFVRDGLPIVARRTPKAPNCVLAGHVLRTVAGVDLNHVKKTTLANAEADGKDGPKEFQRVVASLLRDSPRPLMVTFLAPASDADLVISHAVIQKFISQLEPAQLPSRMQQLLLSALHENASQPTSQAYSDKVLNSVGVAVGKRSVMCNNECALLLDRYLESQVEVAVERIQYQWRLFTRHRKMSAILAMQRHLRGAMGRKKADRVRAAQLKWRASCIVVATLKKWKRFRIYRGASLLQALVRGRAVRKQNTYLSKQATKLQCIIRRRLAVLKRNQRVSDIREGLELRELLGQLRKTVEDLSDPQGAKNKLRLARASWDKSKQQLEDKVKQLQSQLLDSTTQLKKSALANTKTLALKNNELSKALKLKKSVEKKLAEYEARHLSNEEGLKLSDALQALSVLRVKCQEFESREEVSGAAIRRLELQLADAISELAQQKTRSAVLEDKLESTSSLQSKLERAEAGASAARVQLAELTVRLSEAHKQSRMFTSEVFGGEMMPASHEEDDNDEECHHSFAIHFANDENKHGDDDEDDDEERRSSGGENSKVGGGGFGTSGRLVSVLEKKLRQSEYMVEALRNQLADVLTANQHAPMSELHALANCEDIDELSRPELENMLEQARRECSEAVYRADRDESLLLEMSTQRNQLSIALDQANLSLNEVLTSQEAYRTKEAAAAVAAKRLKHAITEANERSAALKASQEETEERRRAAEQELSKTSRELQKTTARCAELEKSLVSLVDECSSAREVNYANNSSVHEKHLKELSLANSATDTAMRQFKQRAEELELELKSQKSLSYSAVSSLETRLKETTTKLSESTRSVTVLEGSVLKLADDLSHITAENKILVSTLEERTNELETLKVDFEKLSITYQETDSKLKIAQDTKTELKAELKQQKALSYSAVSSLESRLEEATAQVKAMTKEKQGLEQDLMSLKSQTDGATHQVNELSEQLLAAEEEVQRLSREVDGGSQEQTSLVKELNEERRRNALLTKQLSRAQSELEESLRENKEREAEEKEAREMTHNLSRQLEEAHTLNERQKTIVDNAASLEAELNKVRAFQASYSQHSARAQQLELLVTELTAKCDDQAKKLNGNPEVLKLRKELSSAQKKEKAHASALDDALASIASMQERAAVAQRRVWQGKVTALQDKLRISEEALEASNKKSSELEAMLRRN